jgi:hypothetical protein
LNEVEGKEQYYVEISNRFAVLENWKAEISINRSRETFRQNIKIAAKESLGCYKLKKHKAWFYKGYCKLLDQRKQAKLQWLQYPSEINEDKLNNIKHEAIRRFTIKKGNIWTTKLMSSQRTVRTRTLQICREE